mgnify:CR=1 FL=1
MCQCRSCDAPPPPPPSLVVCLCEQRSLSLCHDGACPRLIRHTAVVVVGIGIVAGGCDGCMDWLMYVRAPSRRKPSATPSSLPPFPSPSPRRSPAVKLCSKAEPTDSCDRGGLRVNPCLLLAVGHSTSPSHTNPSCLTMSACVCARDFCAYRLSRFVPVFFFVLLLSFCFRCPCVGCALLCDPTTGFARPTSKGSFLPTTPRASWLYQPLPCAVQQLLYVFVSGLASPSLLLHHHHSHLLQFAPVHVVAPPCGPALLILWCCLLLFCFLLPSRSAVPRCGMFVACAPPCTSTAAPNGAIPFELSLPLALPLPFSFSTPARHRGWCRPSDVRANSSG